MIDVRKLSNLGFSATGSSSPSGLPKGQLFETTHDQEPGQREGRGHLNL